MKGGAGNDTYYLGYDATDSIIDSGSSTDIDTVIMPYQLTSYTLPTGIENANIAAGTGSGKLVGNSSNNKLTGNDGANTLDGGLGRDSLFGGTGNDSLAGGADNDVLNGGTGVDALVGGSGQDTFQFTNTANNDKLTDFSVIDDTIQLENSVFNKLTATGALNTSYLKIGTAAADSNDYLIYNKATGALLYDADGNGAGAAVQLATLGVNLALTNADFVVI
jgi:Ca2+-binding RTX toxin-like protein